MTESFYPIVANELGVRPQQVEATALLLAEGGTVPFIARYRKERTGTLDEVQITAIRDRLDQLAELEKRRDAILKSLEERELLTDELGEQIRAAVTLTELEDLYLPYRPKRRTRATIARERGLEELAEILFAQERETDPATEAERFVDPEKEVETVEAALAGARDIIAEWVNENAEARAALRDLYLRRAVVASRVVKGKEEDGAKYRDYFDWSEPAIKTPSHRLLAMRRGEKEGYLYLTMQPDEDEAVGLLLKRFVHGHGPASEQVEEAVRDAFRRLLSLSMETELRLETKKLADAEAIRVFAENLRQLLLAAPLGAKRILAIDPGWRTGCKTVCLDAQGTLLHHVAIFPHTGGSRADEAGHIVRDLVERYAVEAIAVGNGTAGRETEAWLGTLGLPSSIPVVMVDESGASIYSASEVAREEFPDEDVTVRGAVSIGRRLQDPLAELVKIDPKSIGVGQYQHDVDQRELRQSLNDVVESGVNAVGVEVNTASVQLLSYVSGIGTTLAKNIVDYRRANGPFAARKELKKVPRLGDKAFEQAAGFLRIRDAANPLDSSAVHPESYHVVEKMADDLRASVTDLMRNAGLRERIQLQRYVTGEIGLPTLTDIVAELEKP